MHFVFGYNAADSHPIVARRIIKAKAKGAKIIVCDPRFIETARIADIHVPLKNGSNIALLNALAHVIIEEIFTTVNSSNSIPKSLKPSAIWSCRIRQNLLKKSPVSVRR